MADQNNVLTSCYSMLVIFMYIFNDFYRSMLGGIFVYIKFQGLNYLDPTTRRTTVYGLVALNVVAIFAFMFLPKSAGGQIAPHEYGPLKTMKKSFSILISTRMLWLAVACSYAG